MLSDWKKKFTRRVFSTIPMNPGGWSFENPKLRNKDHPSTRVVACSSAFCLEHRHHANCLEEGPCCPSLERESDHQDCNNYRGMTLLSVPGKVFARIILDRVRHNLLEHQRPEQSGFTPKRSTIDRILALRVLRVSAGAACSLC